MIKNKKIFTMLVDIAIIIVIALAIVAQVRTKEDVNNVDYRASNSSLSLDDGGQWPMVAASSTASPKVATVTIEIEDEEPIEEWGREYGVELTIDVTEVEGGEFSSFAWEVRFSRYNDFEHNYKVVDSGTSKYTSRRISFENFEHPKGSFQLRVTVYVDGCKPVTEKFTYYLDYYYPQYGLCEHLAYVYRETGHYGHCYVCDTRFANSGSGAKPFAAMSAPGSIGLGVGYSDNGDYVGVAYGRITRAEGTYCGRQGEPMIGAGEVAVWTWDTSNPHTEVNGSSFDLALAEYIAQYDGKGGNRWSQDLGQHLRWQLCYRYK